MEGNDSSQEKYGKISFTEPSLRVFFEALDLGWIEGKIAVKYSVNKRRPHSHSYRRYVLISSRISGKLSPTESSRRCWLKIVGSGLVYSASTERHITTASRHFELDSALTYSSEFSPSYVIASWNCNRISQSSSSSTPRA